MSYFAQYEYIKPSGNICSRDCLIFCGFISKMISKLISNKHSNFFKRYRNILTMCLQFRILNVFSAVMITLKLF